jgi:hypothetical protein
MNLIQPLPFGSRSTPGIGFNWINTQELKLWIAAAPQIENSTGGLSACGFQPY